MNKFVKLLPIFVLSSALISSPSTKVVFSEDATDPFLNTQIKKANIDTGVENKVFDTMAQHGYDENGNQYLRFLTPFSIKSQSVKLQYTRTYGSDIRTNEVKSVYSGIKYGEEIRYWNGTEFSSTQSETPYYIAAYTIKFDRSVKNYTKDALDYKISAYLSIIDGDNKIDSTVKTTSVNENRQEVTVNIENIGYGKLVTKESSYRVGDLIEFTSSARDESYLSSLKSNGTIVDDLSNLKVLATSSTMNFVANYANGFYSKNLSNGGEITVNIHNGNKTYEVKKENDGYHVKFTHDAEHSWDSVLVNFDKEHFDYNYFTIAYEVLSETPLTEIGVEIGSDNAADKYQQFVGVNTTLEKGVIRRSFALPSAINYKNTYGNIALRFDRTSTDKDVEVVIKSIELVKSTYVNTEEYHSPVEKNPYSNSESFDAKPFHSGMKLTFIEQASDWSIGYLVKFNKEKKYKKIAIELTLENEPESFSDLFLIKTNDYDASGGILAEDGVNQKWAGIHGGLNYIELDLTNPVSKGTGELIIHPGVGKNTGYRSIVIHKIDFIL